MESMCIRYGERNVILYKSKQKSEQTKEDGVLMSEMVVPLVDKIKIVEFMASLIYFRSLHICKMCHINGKYIIK